MVRRRRMRRRLATGRRRLQQDNNAIVPARRVGALAATAGGAALVNQVRDIARRGDVQNAVNWAGRRYREWQAARQQARQAIRSSKRGSFLRKFGPSAARSSGRRTYGGQRGNVAGRYGRRRTPMLSMVKSALPKRILRFQGLVPQEALKQPANTTSGFFGLQHEVLAAGATAKVPLYVVDLNCTNNTGSTYPGVMYSMSIASTGKPVFTPVAGLSNIGTGSFVWNLEYSNMYGTNAQASHLISPSWYDVRLTLYGATAQQTVFYIELIEAAEWYAPVDSIDQFFAVDGTAAQPFIERLKDNVARYWYQKVKNLMSNQIAPMLPTGQRKPSKVYRTLKRWKYTISPKENTEVDTTPNSVTAKLFIRDGRVLSYAWQAHTNFYQHNLTALDTGRDDDLKDPNKYDAPTAATVPPQLFPYPTRRRYLVIRAVNTTSTSAASEDNTNTPSFDMCIRKKEVMQQRTQNVV